MENNIILCEKRQEPIEPSHYQWIPGTEPKPEKVCNDCKQQNFHEIITEGTRIKNVRYA